MLMDYKEFEKYVCDQYRDIFKNNYNEEYAKESAKKIWDSVDDKNIALDAAKVVIDITRSRVLSESKNFDSLQELREQLFDAPSDIKSAFNVVVNHFDTEYFGFLGNITAGLKGAAQGVIDNFRIGQLKSKIDDLKKKRETPAAKVAEIDAQIAKLKEELAKIKARRRD